MDTEELLTPEEAAELIGISAVSVRYAMNHDKLPIVHKYKKRLLRRSDVLAYQPIGHRPKTAPERPKYGRPGRPRKQVEGETVGSSQT